MKRYVAFVFSKDDPKGGMADFVGSFTSPEEARAVSLRKTPEIAADPVVCQVHDQNAGERCWMEYVFCSEFGSGETYDGVTYNAWQIKEANPCPATHLTKTHGSKKTDGAGSSCPKRPFEKAI
jgi:hypothetical protein